MKPCWAIFRESLKCDTEDRSPPPFPALGALSPEVGKCIPPEYGPSSSSNIHKSVLKKNNLFLMFIFQRRFPSTFEWRRWVFREAARQVRQHLQFIRQLYPESVGTTPKCFPGPGGGLPSPPPMPRGPLWGVWTPSAPARGLNAWLTGTFEGKGEEISQNIRFYLIYLSISVVYIYYLLSIYLASVRYSCNRQLVSGCSLNTLTF